MTQSAEDIIRRLRGDPASYQEAANREGVVWGKYFSDPAFLAARAEDQKAAESLGLNTGRPGLLQMLRKNSLRPTRGLSLGCGSGRAERTMLKQGICTSFTGIDVAEDAVKQAREDAAREGLNISYEQQDLNDVSLNPDPGYDLIVCQTILHHVLNLEHLMDEVEKALTPDGVFYVHDYIGETQFQFSDERLYWYNAALAALPQEMRINRMTGHTVNQVRRPEPGKLASPFEAIRSGEISEMLKSRFDVIMQHESMTIIDRVIPSGTRCAYLQDENSRALFKMIQLLDQTLLDSGLLKPLEGRYLLRRRKG
ncbi:class I SAM-dependent methyltransferase [Lysobacter fragariae]